MPAVHRLDPTLLDAVAIELDRSGAAALRASDELLAHYGDTGDTPTQRALDTMIEQAADALRALTDSLADISGDLPGTASPLGTVMAAALHGNAGGTSAHSGRGRGRDRRA